VLWDPSRAEEKEFSWGEVRERGWALVLGLKWEVVKGK
jgi:hypothetical protein